MILIFYTNTLFCIIEYKTKNCLFDLLYFLFFFFLVLFCCLSHNCMVLFRGKLDKEDKSTSNCRFIHAVENLERRKGDRF